ncbi:hypothetical protein H4696_003460 [Amycolatopsis lexingtonensis]|uniref:DUF1707 domain-containing protein n=1 Tax=Amycolatopsis lexingtonensis TaxID=218822 RepID=A0ABR9HZJ4_9PSEU|nr:hypothetical protein [Amycolatopsis lexingtonensis]MBE1496360.1 hypothetical protein [Amycolatopsis lexingtonensis]
MAITLLAGILVLVLLVAHFSPSPRRGWWRRSGEPNSSGSHSGGAGRQAVALERELTARLLTGELTQAGYRDAMARLADDECVRGDDVAMLLWRARLGPAGDDGPADLLDRLGVTLPGVRPGVLCSAAVLASTGAGADELMETLHLTRVQARTVIAAVTTP